MENGGPREGAAGPVRAGLREWIGLAVLILPTLLVSIDVSVMLLALPHITAALGAGSIQSLWIMDIYGFMLAGFMITMGTLGDRIGRRKILMIGASAFGCASLLAAFSTSATMLIASRALLGVAGATLTPSTLALISNMFRDHKQRSFAIGLWLIGFMGGMVVGPVVGGAMLEHFWWGSVFLLGVPVMAVLLVTAPLMLPEYRDDGAGRIDLASVALSLATIFPVVYGLKEVAKHGLQPGPLTAVVVGVAFGAAFVARQRRLESPLLDLRLFRSSTFNTAAAGMFGLTLTGGIMLFITQYLQLVVGLSPLRAGLWMLPGTAASLVGFLVSPLLARRIKPSHLIAVGLTITTAGLLALSRLDASSSLALLAVCFAAFNLGAAPLVSLGTDLVVGSAPPTKAGAAAATSETSAELGFGLGIATLGSIGTYIYRARAGDLTVEGLSGTALALARDTLAGALVAAESLEAGAAAGLVAGARGAFMAGFQFVSVLSAAVIATLALLVVIRLRHILPIGQEEQDEAVGQQATTATPTPATNPGLD